MTGTADGNETARQRAVQQQVVVDVLRRGGSCHLSLPAISTAVVNDETSTTMITIVPTLMAFSPGAPQSKRTSRLPDLGAA